MTDETRAEGNAKPGKPAVPQSGTPPSGPKPEAKPVDIKPEAKPAEITAQAKPVDIKPEAKPAEMTGQAKAADRPAASSPPKPPESKSPEVKPAAQKPTDQKPAGMKPDQNPPAAARGERSHWPLWAAIGVVAIGVIWLAIDRGGPAGVQDPALSGLAGRVAALESRPLAAPAPDARVGALVERIAALESRPAPSGQANDADARAALAALTARLAALESRPAPAAPPPPVDDQARATIAALTARLAALEARPAPPDPREAIAGIEARMSAVAAVAAALEEGKPLGAALGQLPAGTTAPAALAAFATAAPPTLAELRLSFPEAARAAQAASEAEGEGLWERATSRLAGIVTVRKGGEVVVGDATADRLAAVDRALTAGDLAGTVRAAEAVTGRAGEALSTWRARAAALLAARSALGSLAFSR
ncbi:hypothetical protein [Elioraea sp.]|uniref:hypothetical protein n=1 Tax=Elioraea sp. TaxID=2185103 RepID=UPI0025C04A11|nr:hypothetical protein [Elioraea sp.]